MEGGRKDELDQLSDRSSKDLSLNSTGGKASSEENMNGDPPVVELPQCECFPPPPMEPPSPKRWRNYTPSLPPQMNVRFSMDEIMQGIKFVTVVVKKPDGNSGGEAKKIPEEEAICRFCFDVYHGNMFETRCKCKFAMIHESCEVEWSNKKRNNECDVCGEDIQNIPIFVSSSPTRTKEQNRGSTRNRFWRKYF